MSLITQQSAVPAQRDLQENLDVDAVIEVFEGVSLKKNLISCSPPVLPKEGELYIFDLGQDRSKWDSNKRKFRRACVIIATVKISNFLDMINIVG